MAGMSRGHGRGTPRPGLALKSPVLNFWPTRSHRHGRDKGLRPAASFLSRGQRVGVEERTRVAAGMLGVGGCPCCCAAAGVVTGGWGMRWLDSCSSTRGRD
jgi:hypothetical protein